ncbi:Biotin carboxyl carrier protein of acetyl-CoA carboxylase [compost metagenome]|jgi:acetyl-CoA carboxylase biotin carboxyl carrier protein|uniref:acetyl-CoA carboxylase biotin carboxyl carrier protein n=1 Tax=Sphingobacterium faecium TaxID=34087 RepID=UPI000D3A4CC8|nr:acetyl-CoA carboxylase biotin carboxyl carrier protein [Sphingobacterium faecium]MQP27197.1 acetyl-CoA carboxylase biotin carboxyl carrier protein [Sphingobacterium faecium]PTX07844.1 acetyl-CoA carboxylase biotin carboxyl carrier protein [Sphingobacterium faecium]GEM65621.1 acetyl-CoA carboxylase, biotin carboxyl carrier protein [Sphingobacterium faecium NBRC 15299]
MGMDIKQIQDLIKFVSKSGVNEVAIEEKDFKITIKTNQEPTYVTASVPVAAAPMAAAPQPAAVTPAAAPAAVSEDANFITIKSPMIGTFYRSAGPGKPSFVNAGDEINTGNVLCIIEAMKLFNEIESEVSGKIVKILVEDAQPVEFDQPLFLVDPR